MSAGTRIGGRYALEEELGRGAMARVYRARDEELRREVAVKVLAEHLTHDTDLRERFVREAQHAARLHHPNVVAVYDAGTHGERPFIVTELVRGTTLAERAAGSGALPPEEAKRIVRQAALGLAEAHAAGIVHRDVKPQNLLLAGDGTVKVADFGVARADDLTSATAAGTVLGTAAYLAPEQARGEAVGAAADVYSLGAVLYELLTGRPPYEFRTLADLVSRQETGAITPVRDLAPGVPPALEELTMRCLALDPRYRPTARDVAAALGGRGEALPPTAVMEAPRRPLPRPGRAAAVALAAAAAAGALALALALGGGDTQDAPAGPVPRGETPAEDARNLADWIRERTED